MAELADCPAEYHEEERTEDEVREESEKMGYGRISGVNWLGRMRRQLSLEVRRKKLFRRQMNWRPPSEGLVKRSRRKWLGSKDAER